MSGVHKDIEDIEEITGLVIINRKISSDNLKTILHRGGCTAVTLETVRPDLTFNRAVAVVVSSPGYVREGKNFYSVTDMRGNIAQLYLSNFAKQKLGLNSEGGIVVLLNPVVTIDTSKGYTLKFTVENQQDLIFVGSCKNFSRCNGLRKDGKPCTMPVDLSVDEKCRFHKNSLNQTQSITRQESAIPPRIIQPKPQPKPQPSFELDTFLSVLQGAPSNSRSLSTIAKEKPSILGGCDFIEEVEGELGPTQTSGETLIIGRRDGGVAVPTQSTIFSSRLSDVNRSKSSSQLIPPPLGQSQTSSNSILNASLLTRPLTASTPSNQLEARWKIGSLNVHEKEKERKREILLKSQRDSMIALGNGGQHSILLSLSTLQQNTNSLMKKRGRESGDVSSKTGGVISSQEIESLLNRNSVNEKQAVDEWTDNFIKKLKTIEKKEEQINQNEGINSISIRASHCLNCNRYTDQPLPLCIKGAHHVVTVYTKKRFFECQQCGRRDHILGPGTTIPSHRCQFCGQSSWQSCGKNRSGHAVSGSRLDRCAESRERGLVVSLSETTSRKDRDRMTAIHSSLDYTAK